MAKFKVGDILLHTAVIHSGYEVKVTAVTSTHYSIEVINPAKTGVPKGYKYDDQHSYVDNGYVLKTPVKTFNAYLKGDQLEMRSLAGFVIEILDTKNGLYEYKVIKTMPKCSPVNAIMSDTYDLIEQNYRLYSFATPAAAYVQGVLGSSNTLIKRVGDSLEIIKAITTKQCTCDSRALFLKGCKCGAVQPYKLKMR